MHRLQLQDFTCHELSDGLTFFVGRVPESLLVNETQFESLWALHPEKHHVIHMINRPVPVPRWQQAFGVDYHFSGGVNTALPTPVIIQPFLEWAQVVIDTRLNGILVNWYDGSLGHYIGKHRDSTKNMIDGAAIVTISIGQERIFRIRPWKGAGYRDFPTAAGSVFVMPFETNRRCTHEVPKSEKCLGRRISITLRAFDAS